MRLKQEEYKISSYRWMMLAKWNMDQRLSFLSNQLELSKSNEKGAFSNGTASFKLLYLRISELEKKWSIRSIANWPMELKQLMVNDSLKEWSDK